MRLRSFLNPDFVVLSLRASDAEAVLTEVAERAGAAGLGAPDTIRRALLERERQHPTVMGAGLAIPHAAVPGLEAPVLGIALAPEPIEFGGPEMEPVRAFFVLLSPPGHEREHVKVLARICRLVRHENFLDELRGADDEREVVAIVEQVDDQHA